MRSKVGVMIAAGGLPLHISNHSPVISAFSAMAGEQSWRKFCDLRFIPEQEVCDAF
jgi:hypothetical protein